MNFNTVHRSKRQPPITSFFTPSTDPLPSAHATTASTVTASRPLASDVQSQLLNVGMRVRKAVSNGYKTKSSVSSCGYGSYAEYFPEAARKPLPIQDDEWPSGCLAGGSKSCYSYATLSKPHETALQIDELQNITPFSSQESTTSVASINITAHPTSSWPQTRSKRKAAPDFEIYEPLLTEERSHAVNAAFRKYAVPRGKRNSQEGMTGTMEIDDFDDPAWLQPKEDLMDD